MHQEKLGSTLRKIADDLRRATNADDFRDHMRSFLFLRYLAVNYETAAKTGLMHQLFPSMENVEA